MVCLAKETICKPLNEREHKFYKTMGKTLIPFVPRYEGTMRVEVHEDDLGIPHHMFYKKEITKILCFVFLRSTRSFRLKSKSTKKWQHTVWLSNDVPAEIVRRPPTGLSNL